MGAKGDDISVGGRDSGLPAGDEKNEAKVLASDTIGLLNVENFSRRIVRIAVITKKVIYYSGRRQSEDYIYRKGRGGEESR